MHTFKNGKQLLEKFIIGLFQSRVKVEDKSLLLRSIVLIVLLAGLSACATVPDLSTSVPAARSSSIEVVAGDKVKVISNDLNKELLEGLVISRFSSHYSDWNTGFSNEATAAKISQDWRVAKRAASLAYFLAKNFAGAFEMAELWLQLQPNSEQAQLYLFASGVASGRTSDVISVAENYIRNHSKGTDYALKLMSEYLRAQPNSDASTLIFALEPRFSDSANFLYEAVLINATFKRDKAARNYLARTLELNPDHKQANLFKYKLISIESGNQAANNYLKERIIAYPDSKSLRDQHLNNLYDKSEFQEIIDVTDSLSGLSSGLSIEKNDAEAWYLRGASLVQLERLPEAEFAFSQVLSIDSTDQNTRFQLGRFYYVDGKYAEAIKILSEVSSEEHYFSAGLLMARAMTKMHEGELGVLRALRKINGLTANTKSKIIQRALTQSELLEGIDKPLSAIGYLSEALNSYPDDAKLLYSRGLLASEQRELAMAEVDFNRLIALQPKNAAALNALGYTLIEQTQRYAEAQVLIDKALAIEPDSEYILDSAGWLAYLRGDSLKALPLLKRAYAKSKQTEVAAHLGEVLFMSGDVDEAKRIWLDAFNAVPTDSVLNETMARFGFSPDN